MSALPFTVEAYDLDGAPYIERIEGLREVALACAERIALADEAYVVVYQGHPHPYSVVAVYDGEVTA